MKRAALFNALPSPETLSILRSSSVTNLAPPRLSNHQTPIAIRRARIRHPMSSSSPSDVKSNTTEEQQQAEKHPSENTKTKKKEAPSPPEKPEAGDCCGSGCVRCVWDVYYDELEEYDRLRKEFDSSPNESPED